MSYCRWSSDDSQCDVYCYESTSGWETHVASRRYDLTEPLPDPLPTGCTDGDAILARLLEVQRILDSSPLRDIGLPCDGNSFCDPSPGAAADTLVMLRETGYQVPQSAIDALRAEQADLDRP